MDKKKQLLGIFLVATIGYSSLTAQTDNLPIANSKKKFDYYFYLAMNAKALDKHEEAFDYLNYCMAADSTNANVLYELGTYYNTLDNKNKAMNYYRKATQYDASNFEYKLAYANLCLELNQYSDAIALYENLLNDNTDNTELYVYLSEAYRMNSNYPKAIEILDKLEQQVGLNEKISIQKYQLYTIQKQESKAFEEIQKYIQKYPNEIKYQILLGSIYLQAGKTNEAYLVFSKAKAIDPDNPYLITAMAQYYEQIGNKPAAETEMHLALISPKLDIDSKLGILGQYIGTLQQNKQSTETTNALFDTLMVQHPQEPQLNLMYGNLLMLQKRTAEARFQYQLFTEADPSNPIGWEQILMTAFPDSLNLSIDICKKAIGYIPDQPQFFFYKGMAEYMKEEYDNALLSFQTGVVYVNEANKGLLSDFYGQIGDLYHQLNKQDSSFMMYEKALNYNPQNISILNNYSYFLSLARKDLDRAEKMSSATVQADPTNPTYLDTYGWVLFEQGAYVMSKIYIEKAITYSEEKKTPISADVLEHYGDVLSKTDEIDKALEYWIKAKKTGESKSKTLDKKIETKTYIVSQ